MSKQSRGAFASQHGIVPPERARSAIARRLSLAGVETQSPAREPRGLHTARPTQRPASKRINYDYDLDRLLLVVGVSGSGKTTFIERLAQGKLAAEIRAALPDDVVGWNVVSGRKPHWLRRLLHEPRPAPGGQILHYEITHRFEARPHEGSSAAVRLFSVADDPLLKLQLAAAREIHVVIVSAPGARLIRQLRVRSFLLHVPAPLRPYASWLAPALQRLETLLPAWIKANPGRLLGQRWRHRSQMRERNDQLTAIYADPGMVDAIYRHWLGSLLNEFRGRLRGPLVCVEPDPHASGAFRLARATSTLSGLCADPQHAGRAGQAGAPKLAKRH